MKENTPKVNYPLMRIGIYGTHIITSPKGTYIFVGSVPYELSNKSFKTEKEAVDAFLGFFNGMTVEDKEKYTPMLRDDIRAMIN